MDRGDRCGHFRLGFASSPDRGQAMSQRPKGVADERRTEAADAVLPTCRYDLTNALDGQLFRVEALAVATVDLEVKQGRRDPFCFIIRRCLRRRTNRRNSTLLAKDLQTDTGCVMTGLTTHGG